MRYGGTRTRADTHGWRLALLAFALAVLTTGPEARAQVADTPALVLRGVPLAEALQQLVDATGISLVYTSDLVADEFAYCAAPRGPAEALLACVLRDSGLDYFRSSSGAYVLIAAVEAPPPRGDLAGRVVDAATGEALPFAHVLLADAGTGTTTDEAGHFTFGGLLSGRHRVSVRYLGYEPAEDEVTVPAHGRERVVVALRPRLHALRPLVVDGLRQRPASDTLGAGRVEAIGLTALRSSGTPDLALAAADLPGVAALQPLADLQIQGGGGGEYLTLLDGAPVRNPVSLGRHLAAFSPLALERLTVHRAGFGTAWSHLTGVVAVEHDVAGTDRFNVDASADAVSFNGQAQGRLAFGDGREAAGMVAARTSAWDVYRDPGLSSLLTAWDAPDPLLLARWSGYPVTADTNGLSWTTPDAAFSDVHAAARLRLSPFHTVHASAYRARDRLAGEFGTFVPDSRDARAHLLLTRDDYDWRNEAGQARLDGLLGARAAYTLQATGGRHASRYGYGGGTHRLTAPPTLEALAAAADTLRPALAAAADWYHTIREIALKGALSYSLSPRSHLEGGLAFEHAEARIDRSGALVAPLAHGVAAWDMVAHATGRLTLGRALAVEPGIRLTYFPALETVYAEPRLSLRYDGAAGPLGPYAARLATGLYRQFTNEYLLSSNGATAVVPYVLFWLPPDGSLAPPRAYHVAAEAALWPSERWTVEASAYFKSQPRLLALDYAALVPVPLDPSDPELVEGSDAGERAQADFLGASRGRAYGGTVRVRRHGARLTAGAAYTLSEAARQVPSRFDGRMVPVPGNAPHAVALDAAFHLSGGLRVGASWRGAWGRSWAFRRAYYDYLAFAEGPDALAPYALDRPEAHVLPAASSLDLDLTLTRTLAGATVQARALVANVLDRHDAYDWSLAPTDGDPTVLPRLMPGRHFAFSLRFVR